MGHALQVRAGPPERLAPELLKSAFDASPEGLALTEDKRILYANPVFAELFGYTGPSQVLGKTLASFRPEGQPCTGIDCPDPARTSRGNRLCAFTGHGKDGAAVQVEASCASFRAQNREFVVVNVRDVSQRERRRLVRDSDRRFRAIFDAAPMGIVQCDMKGRVLKSNPAVARMLGYSRDELRGMHFRDFTHPEDVDRDVRLFEELVAGEREAYELELRYRKKDGGSGWVHLTVSLVRAHDREAQFAIAMTEDITERKRAEQQLRKAQKMEAVGRLVGGVAHDFNNLLTGILLYCDLLAADLEPHGRQRHHADEIRLAVEQGAALIQQLLAISRQQVIEPRILSINRTILETGNLLSRLIGENLELGLDLDERLGNVKMDPAQVQQILLNLVLNARDAISGTGRITVATTNCEFQPADSGLAQGAIPGIQLSVTDTGCGMAAETQSHLFEPFFTTKTSGRGNGLGLATVQGIVRNAGGTIQVESELGKGTCFTIILPRVPDTPSSRVSEILYSPGSGGETVLLVEDNLTVRQAARGILSESGYQVLEAANGAEALAVAQAHPCAIHLLVADLVMPGMSGRELVRELRTARPDLSVLFMTGYEPQPTGEPECNPVIYFRKPFTGAALLEKVHGILEDAARKSLKKCEGKRENL